jgi:hypothetical protein
MGWCSGTDIFDAVAREVLKRRAKPVSAERLLTVLAEALEDGDWDCQNESEYWEHPVVRKVFQNMHPDWDLDE